MQLDAKYQMSKSEIGNPKTLGTRCYIIWSHQDRPFYRLDFSIYFLYTKRNMFINLKSRFTVMIFASARLGRLTNGRSLEETTDAEIQVLCHTILFNSIFTMKKNNFVSGKSQMSISSYQNIREKMAT